MSSEDPVKRTKKKKSKAGAAAVRPLSAWPNEVLAVLSQSISGYDIGRLYLTGDSILRSKLEQGGVQCFQIYIRDEAPASGMVRWPTLASKLKGLETFILDAVDGVGLEPRVVSHIRPDLLPPTVTELRLTCMQAERCFLRHPPAFEYVFPHQLMEQESVDMATFTDSEEWSGEEEEPESRRWEDDRGQLAPHAQLCKRVKEVLKQRHVPTSGLEVYSMKNYRPICWEGASTAFFNFGAALPQLATLVLQGDLVWEPEHLALLPVALTHLELNGHSYQRLGRTKPKWENLKAPPHLTRLALGDRQPSPPDQSLLPILLSMHARQFPSDIVLARATTELDIELMEQTLDVSILPPGLRILSVNFINRNGCFDTSKSWPLSLTKMALMFGHGRRKLPSVYPPQLKSLSLAPFTEHLTEAEACSLPSTIDELVTAGLTSKKSFAHFTRLRSLVMYQSSTLSESTTLPSTLTSLHLGEFDISEPLARAIFAGLPLLTKLRCGGKFSSSISQALPRQLEHLDIRCLEQVLEEDFMLHMPVTLKYLYLVCVKMHQVCLERLPPTLTHLSIRGKIRRPSPMAFAKLPRTLTELRVPVDVFRAAPEEAWALLPPALSHYNLLFPFSIQYETSQTLPRCMFILQCYLDKGELKTDRPED